MKTLLRFISIAAAFCLVSSAQAQDWPDKSKPIRVVVPFGAGASSDVIARLLARHLSSSMSQPVIVENRPGAAGVLGHEAVMHAPADGYTLLLTSTAPLLIVPLTIPSAKFSHTDFTPIGTVASVSFVVLTSTGAGFPSTMEDLLARLKDGKGTYASPGVGTTPHLGALLILRNAKREAVHVPYKESGQALQETASGLVTFSLDTTLAARSLIQAGKVRPLAVTGTRRLAELDQVPTLAEAGIPNTEITSTVMLLGPAGLPRPIVERLNAELNKVIQLPEVTQQLLSYDSLPEVSSPARLTQRIVAEEATWKEIAKSVNLRP